MADQEFTTFNEIWKPIPGFPGYEVSDHGRVRSYWFQTGTGFAISVFPQRIRKPTIHKGRYQLPLNKNGKSYSRQIHRLVCLAFKGPCPKGFEVCHNDGNPQNNYIGNLRYDTRSNNHMDKHHHGTMPLGEKCPWAILKNCQVSDIKRLYAQGLNQTQIAKLFHVSNKVIWAIVHQQNWKHVV